MGKSSVVVVVRRLGQAGVLVGKSRAGRFMYFRLGSGRAAISSLCQSSQHRSRTINARSKSSTQPGEIMIARQAPDLRTGVGFFFHFVQPACASDTLCLWLAVSRLLCSALPSFWSADRAAHPWESACAFQPFLCGECTVVRAFAHCIRAVAHHHPLHHRRYGCLRRLRLAVGRVYDFR
jgi:hypothetical protein